MQELEICVKNLKLGKSTGPSGILSEMIKSTFTDISPILSTLYIRIFETSQFPSSWGQSILCPFFKSGSLNDPNNYRGISLIDTLNKILTGMMFNRLTQWANTNQKVDEVQSGFKKGYSTIDNLFTLQAMIQKYISKKGADFIVCMSIFVKLLTL